VLSLPNRLISFMSTATYCRTDDTSCRPHMPLVYCTEQFYPSGSLLYFRYQLPVYLFGSPLVEPTRHVLDCSLRLFGMYSLQLLPSFGHVTSVRRNGQSFSLKQQGPNRQGAVQTKSQRSLMSFGTLNIIPSRGNTHPRGVFRTLCI
jgi:hypothetical protein